MKIAVYCSAKDRIPSDYLALGDALGAWIAESGHTLVYGGATGGLMSRVSDAAKAAGGRVGWVGTTSCRTIESGAAEDGTLKESAGWTNIFIYPGYRFKVLDALVTNFHLPESTLIMLVSALAGRDHVLEAYRQAVEERYRFFSFGDAMFIS